jgi:hypothetical protein
LNPPSLYIQDRYPALYLNPPSLYIQEGRYSISSQTLLLVEEGKMRAQTVAVLLLLVCAVVICGGNKRGRCDNADKKKVLDACGYYIRSGHPKELPSKGSSCCEVAQFHDMQCIADILNDKEKKDYDQGAIVDLADACGTNH